MGLLKYVIANIIANVIRNRKRSLKLHFLIKSQEMKNCWQTAENCDPMWARPVVGGSLHSPGRGPWNAVMSLLSCQHNMVYCYYHNFV